MAKIYLLGTGTPTPTPTRFGSSHVIKVSDEYLMFDCGPAATHKLVKAGLWPTQIDYLFFSHHHFDHVLTYSSGPSYTTGIARREDKALRAS